MSDSGLPKDFVELMQKMWNPMMFPIPGVPLPTADIAELERKLIELKTVERWLSMNIGLVQMSVKTIEMQKSALEALAAGTKKSDKK